MLKNYLKITWTVMKRRKFYTFISLFGICFTLTSLIILAALADHLFAPSYPENKADRTLFVSFNMVHNPQMTSYSYNSLSFSYIEKYIKTLKMPEKVGLSSGNLEPSINLYINNRSEQFTANYTDAAFWDITHFTFSEGKPYTEQNIKNNEKLVVITEQVSQILFGKGVLATGKEIIINNTHHRIAGVVKGVSSARITLTGDMYFPYNALTPEERKSDDIAGRFTALILAKNKTDIPAIQAEYQAMLKKVQLPKERIGNDNRQEFTSLADSHLENILRGYAMAGFFDRINMTPPQLGRGNLFEFKDKLVRYALLSSLIFMLLPAINLVNLVNSRIMERASEIGIRKAFGATSVILTQQFVVENVLLTLFGGALSLILATLFIAYFNQNDILTYAQLAINWKVVIVAVMCSLILGLLSGVYPAWRMSKLNVADAIKQTA